MVERTRCMRMDSPPESHVLGRIIGKKSHFVAHDPTDDRLRHRAMRATPFRSRPRRHLVHSRRPAARIRSRHRRSGGRSQRFVEQRSDIGDSREALETLDSSASFCSLVPGPSARMLRHPRGFPARGASHSALVPGARHSKACASLSGTRSCRTILRLRAPAPRSASGAIPRNAGATIGYLSRRLCRRSWRPPRGRRHALDDPERDFAECDDVAGGESGPAGLGPLTKVPCSSQVPDLNPVSSVVRAACRERVWVEPRDVAGQGATDHLCTPGFKSKDCLSFDTGQSMSSLSRI